MKIRFAGDNWRKSFSLYPIFVRRILTHITNRKFAVQGKLKIDPKIAAASKTACLKILNIIHKKIGLLIVVTPTICTTYIYYLLTYAKASSTQIFSGHLNTNFVSCLARKICLLTIQNGVFGLTRQI